MSIIHRVRPPKIYNLIWGLYTLSGVLDFSGMPSIKMQSIEVTNMSHRWVVDVFGCFFQTAGNQHMQNWANGPSVCHFGLRRDKLLGSWQHVFYKMAWTNVYIRV